MRAFLIVALCVAVLGSPAQAAMSGLPVFTVDVHTVGTITARITVNDRDETAIIAGGKSHTFTFPEPVTKFRYDIIGCGRSQTKIVPVTTGRLMAKITVYASCSLVVEER